MLGVDLNPSVIGWAYCDREGNLKAAGQIKLNLRDRSTNQVKATIGDGVKQLVDIASFYQCPITIERLGGIGKVEQLGVGIEAMLIDGGRE